MGLTSRVSSRTYRELNIRFIVIKLYPEKRKYNYCNKLQFYTNMEVIGRSKMLIESSSEERVSYKRVIAPPNTPITATPPNTPHKSKLNEKNICLEDISTVSVDETLSYDEPIENRRKSTASLAIQEDSLPKMQEKFKSLRIKKMEENNSAEYNPEKYSDAKYAQSSPTMPRAKMLSPNVSPISSEFNSIDDDDDEGRFSEFMKVFGRKQENLNRFISEDELLQMSNDTEISYEFEDSKSFLNNVREISYEDSDQSLLN